METAEKTKIQQQLVQLIEKMLQISASHLVNIVSGSFDKVSETLLEKIAYKLSLNEWNIAETLNFKRIQGLCYNAHNLGLRNCLIAKPGSGKSAGLKSYAKGKTDVVYVEAEEFQKKKQFVRDLLAKVGVNEDGTVAYMMSLLIERLNKRKFLLIVDEVGELNDPALKILKTLSNKTESGIILSGTPSFKKRLSKGIDKNKETYEEIYSRFGREFVTLKEIDTLQISDICLANKVSDTNDIMLIVNQSENDLRRVKRLVENLKLQKSI